MTRGLNIIFIMPMKKIIFFSILTKALVTAKAAKEAHNYTDTAGFSLK